MPAPPVRLLVRCAAALLLAACAVAFGASGASAHAVLRSTSPRAGAVLTAAPAQVLVTFDDTVGAPAFLTVTGPAGRIDAGSAQVAGDHVSVPLRVGAPAGAYAVAYRVVSDDGHPVQGTFGYTLQLPAGTSASASTTAAGAVPSASAASPGPGRADAAAAPPVTGATNGAGRHPQHWFAGVAGGAMVVAGAGALVWERRQRGRRSGAGTTS